MTEKNILFSPVKTRRAFEEVSTEIKKLIVQGVFKNGDRLPTEAEIARQFKVGRQTVREAIRILELSGYISVQKGGGGTIIMDNVLTRLSNSFVDVIQLENLSVDELTVARMDIEKLVLEHAVRNATESDIKALLLNISEAREDIRQGVPAADHNASFHVLLAKASQNRVFMIVVEAIMTIVTNVLRRIPQDVQMSERVYREHGLIVEAVVAKDKVKAIKLMEAHLMGIHDRFRESFEQIAMEGRV